MCGCCKGGLGIAPCVWLLQGWSGDCTVCVTVARVGLGIAPCVWLLQGWVWGLHRACDCCKGGSGDSTVRVTVARVGLGIAPCV